MRTKAPKKPAKKVPAPTSTSMKMFGAGGNPRKPSQPRIYSKAAVRQDPMEFAMFGFGDTGMTGRS